MFSRKKHKTPSFKQWAQFFKILNLKEKVVFLSLIFITLFSFSAVFSKFIDNNTILVPAQGGELKEGKIGQPQFINPLYAYSSQTDKELIELTFSGLFNYDSKGNIIPDLVSDYSISSDGKSIEFSIKENVKWHDNQPLNIDDVIFTFNLIQDPNYLSPLRANFQGVEIEKMSDYKALIRLKQKYSGFFDNLINLKILPKHIWKDIPASRIMSNEKLNLLSPIGSGAYVIKKVEKDKEYIKSIELEINKNYYNPIPNITNIKFIFFEKRDDMINALKKGIIDAVMIDTAGEYNLEEFKNLNINLIKTPNYFSLFYNNNKNPLNNKEIRKALDLAINKEEVLEKGINNQGEIVSSPILPNFYGFNAPENLTFEDPKTILQKQGFEEKNGVMTKTIKKTTGFEFKKVLNVGSSGADVNKLQECLAQDPEIYSGEITGYFGNQTKEAVILFQEKYKEEVLTPGGLTKGNGSVGTSTIKKLNEVCFQVPDEEIKLSFVIKTVENPCLIKTAENIKEQWEKIGVKVEIKKLDSTEIKKTIRDRDFDILLFGKKLGGIPNFLPFWHSSQIIDPGLNLSMYKNEIVDGLLEKERMYSDYKSSERQAILEELQNTLIKDYPATFLYSSYGAYITNKKIEGISLDKLPELEKKFIDIYNWYIKEKRTWKQDS